MFVTKLFFLVLIIVCIVFYILYIWDFSLVLLIVIAAIPIIMFTLLLITKYLMRVEFHVAERSVSKNEPFDVQLCVTNRSILPIGKAEAVIEYMNVFNSQVNEIELHFPVQPCNSQRVTFQLTSKFCGTIRVRCAYITIFDPLRIFKFKVGKNISATIAVLPEGHEIAGCVSENCRLNEDSSVFSEHTAGDDPSEVFDLREYVNGDKPNRIHWKLSSKKDELIVKEYSLPVDAPAVIYLDLNYSESSEYTLPIFDTLAELLVSVSQFMAENERIHTIAYYSVRESAYVEKVITDINDLASAVSELIYSMDEKMCSQSPEQYLIGKDCSLASFTLITAQADEKVLSYIDDSVDADIKNALLVQKNCDADSDYSSVYSDVNIIPVAVGHITASVRDLEL